MMIKRRQPETFREAVVMSFNRGAFLWAWLATPFITMWLLEAMERIVF